MSILRTADEPPIPPAFWFWFAVLAGFVAAAVWFSNPKDLRPRLGRNVPACSYCAVAIEDGPATFVRSCSGGCDERA